MDRPTGVHFAFNDSTLQEHDTGRWSWYLLHTKPRQESVAQDNLQRQGYTCYLPLYQREVVRRGKLQTAQEALFARYLFIRLDSSPQGLSWAPIRSTTGVSALVRFGSTPARVDDALVSALREREQQRPAEKLFASGDTVRIASGALAGLEAIYQCTDAQQRAVVLLTLMGQSVRTQLNVAQLQPCA